MMNIKGRLRIWLLNERLAKLRRQSDLEGALMVARQVEALSMRVHGVGHPNYALSMNNLAVTLCNLGRSEEGEAILVRAVEMMREAGKARGLEYGACLSSWGGALCKLGRLEEGIATLEEAQVVLKKVGHPDYYAECLHNLALAYRSAGDTRKAKVLLTIALDLRRRRLGKNHPDTIRTFNALQS